VAADGISLILLVSPCWRNRGIVASAETTSGVARVAVGAELVKRDLLGGGEPFNGAQERWVLIYPGCQPGKL